MTAQLSLPLPLSIRHRYAALDPEVDAAVEREMAAWRALAYRDQVQRHAARSGARRE